MKRCAVSLMACLVAVFMLSCATPMADVEEHGPALAPADTSSPAASASKPADSASPDRVSMNYPEPTEISKIAADVSRWSGKTFILDRSASGSVSILAAEPLPADVAYQRFVSALDQLGLGLVESDNIVTIESLQAIKRTQGKIDFVTPLQRMADNDLVKFSYTSPTELKDIIADVAKWEGQRYVLDRQVGGKVMIFSDKQLPKDQAYRIFRRTLLLLGYAEVARGPVNQVLPIKVVNKLQDVHLATMNRFSSLPGTTTFNFPQPTEVKDITKKVAQMTGANIILDREANGKVEILASGEVSKPDAYKIFLVSLDSLGLGAAEDKGAIRILPLRVIRKASSSK